MIDPRKKCLFVTEGTTTYEIMKEFLPSKPDEAGRKWMNNLFRVQPQVDKMFIVATDGYSLVYRKADDPELNYGTTEKIRHLIVEEFETFERITIDQLESCFKEMEWVTEWNDTRKEVTCLGCMGEGTVEWEVTLNNREYTKHYDCPVCKGNGWFTEGNKVPTGFLVPDNWEYVSIGGKLIFAHQAVQLYRIAKQQKRDILYRTDPEALEKSPLHFKIGDLYVVMMEVQLSNYILPGETKEKQQEFKVERYKP